MVVRLNFSKMKPPVSEFLLRTIRLLSFVGLMISRERARLHISARSIVAAVRNAQRHKMHTLTFTFKLIVVASVNHRTRDHSQV